MAKRWYIVHAHSNFEQRVKDGIIEKFEKQGLSDLLGDVVVPTERVVAVRMGKKYDVDRRYYPGYVLVNFELNDTTFHIVGSVPKVTGFLGSNSKPFPIRDSEAERILEMMSEGVASRTTDIHFDIGEQVTVSSGPFAMFSGVVEEVDEARRRIRVAVSIFGRPTPVDCEFGQVEKNANIA